jgi:hypothetical protein
VSDGGVFGGLRASLGFFPISINIVVDGAIQAESAKLNSGAVNLITVPGHSDSLELVERTPRKGWLASRRLGRSSGKAADGGPASLMLLMGGGYGGCSRAGLGGARVPGISGLASSGFGFGRMRIICNLVEICLSELILGRQERDLGNRNRGNNRNSWNGRNNRLSRSSGCWFLDGFGSGLLGRGRNLEFGLRLGLGRLSWGQRFHD